MCFKAVDVGMGLIRLVFSVRKADPYTTDNNVPGSEHFDVSNSWAVEGLSAKPPGFRDSVLDRTDRTVDRYSLDPRTEVTGQSSTFRGVAAGSSPLWYDTKTMGLFQLRPHKVHVNRCLRDEVWRLKCELDDKSG